MIFLYLCIIPFSPFGVRCLIIMLLDGNTLSESDYCVVQLTPSNAAGTYYILELEAESLTPWCLCHMTSTWSLTTEGEIIFMSPYFTAE